MEIAVRPGDMLLGKYRVERVLGQGGMGVVVAARHVELDELFAIKLLLPRAAGNAHAASRFVREARAAVRLSSEHVAKVQDVGRLDDGTPYMVMEHLTGSDLATILLSRGALPLGEAIQLVLQACDAIAEAHALKIIHRDLKPANLFLTHRRNGKPCLKVLDFGISKQAEATEQLTSSGAIIGSPFYMSPEQIENPRTVDARTDIWAMGVVLYELTTGEMPFPGESLPNLIHTILTVEPHAPSRLRPELPPALDEVVMRCLGKEPRERYGTIEEFAAAVRSIEGSTGDGPPWRAPAQNASPEATLEAHANGGTAIPDGQPSPPPGLRRPPPSLPAVQTDQGVLSQTPALPDASTQVPLSSTVRPQPARRRKAVWLAATVGGVAIGIGVASYTRLQVTPDAAVEPPAQPTGKAMNAGAPSTGQPPLPAGEVQPGPSAALQQPAAAPGPSSGSPVVSSKSVPAAKAAQGSPKVAKPSATPPSGKQAALAAPPPARSGEPHEGVW